jgi:hypothetical protein
VLGHASAAMTMDLHGHLIDRNLRNLWDAADRLGATAGASSDEGPEDEGGRTDGKPALTRANREPPWGSNRRSTHYERVQYEMVADDWSRPVLEPASLSTASDGQRRPISRVRGHVGGIGLRRAGRSLQRRRSFS